MSNKTNLRLLKRAEELLTRLNGEVTEIDDSQRDAIKLLSIAIQADLDFAGNDDDNWVEPKYIRELGGLEKVHVATLTRLKELELDEDFRNSIIANVDAIFTGIRTEI